MSQMQHEDRRTWIRSALSAYEKPLTRYAARITGDAESARDAVQESFLQLCSEDPEQLNGKLAPWLFTVCRNRALDLRRKAARLRVGVAEPITEPHETRSGPAEVLERQEGAGQVMQLLDKLPDTQQEVIRLRFQDSLSYKAIAQVTGLSVSNVGYLIHTAIKTIRKRLADDA